MRPLVYALFCLVQQYDAGNDRLYRAYLAATIVGVFVGFVGLVFLVYQTVLTRRSANAAKASADALIGAERPWILLSKASLEFDHIQHSDDAPVIGPRWHAVVIFTITNVGKTPAIVNGVGGGVELVADLSHPFQNIEYNYKGEGRRIIGPGQDETVRFVMEASVEQKELAAIQQGKLTGRYLMAFGNIEYRDTFEEDHVSRFCLIYRHMGVGFVYLCHNPLHNKYT